MYNGKRLNKLGDAERGSIIGTLTQRPDYTFVPSSCDPQFPSVAPPVGHDLEKKGPAVYPRRLVLDR